MTPEQQAQIFQLVKVDTITSGGRRDDMMPLMMLLMNQQRQPPQETYGIKDLMGPCSRRI